MRDAYIYAAAMVVLAILTIALYLIGRTTSKKLRRAWLADAYFKPQYFLLSTNDGPDPCTNDREIELSDVDDLTPEEMFIDGETL